MDMYAEYIIKRKKDVKNYLLNILYIFAAVVLSGVTFLFGGGSPMLSSIVTLVIMLIWYGAVILIRNQNVEYEYILTNGELDVDKIISGKSRKRVLTVHCKIFETFAPVEDGAYNVFSGTEIDVSKSKDSKTAYYAVFSRDGERVRMKMEASRSMLKIIKKYAGNRATLREGDAE